MKNTNVCTGCGKRCSLKHPGCNYGRRCAQRQASAVPEENQSHKWEKYVEHGGAGWQLLSVGREAKRVLKSGRRSESELLSALNDAEREQLVYLLQKISASCLKKSKQCYK